MIISEKAALSKRCPMNAGKPDRHNPAIKRCVGSECMAWIADRAFAGAFGGRCGMVQHTKQGVDDTP